MSVAVGGITIQDRIEAIDRFVILTAVERHQPQTQVWRGKMSVFGKRGAVSLVRLFQLAELFVSQAFLKRLFSGQLFNRTEVARNRIGGKDRVGMSAIGALDVLRKQGPVGGANLKAQRSPFRFRLKPFRRQ